MKCAVKDCPFEVFRDVIGPRGRRFFVCRRHFWDLIAGKQLVTV